MSDLIRRDAAKDAIERRITFLRSVVSDDQTHDRTAALMVTTLEPLLAAIDAIPAAEGGEWVAKLERQYNKHGEPVCPHCNQATNRTYAKHRILQCWSCGKYMPELPE